MIKVYGRDDVQPQLANEGYFFKGLLNAQAIAFFVARIAGHEVQHRDVKHPELSYEDDYKGNAMALVIKPKKIEIRFHDRFSDSEVGKITKEIKELPELEFARDFQVTYQGRVIDPGKG